MQGLPTDAGVYNIKLVVAQDDVNYTLAAETVRVIEILKASQTLTFSSECYKLTAGEKVNVIVGGAFADITANYMNGYTITAGGTYEVRVTNGAGVTVNATITMDDIRKSQIITTDKDVYNAVYGKSKSFTIGAESDKKTALTYKSSDDKVAVVGNDGKVTVKVLPKKPKLKTLASNKKKTIVAGWKRDKMASGYQIRYADNKNFKKSKSITVKKNKTTSVKIKNLKKKKTYYVKVRSYKLSAGEKIYSSYSKAKRVKIK